MFLKLTLLVAILIQSLCCLSGCKHCISQGTVCFACQNDSLVPTIGGGCFQRRGEKISDCAIYLRNGLCLKCEPTFQLSSNRKQCTKTYDGCLQFDEKDKCIKCGFGLKLLNGLCEGIANCLEYQQNQESKCKICLEGTEQKGQLCLQKEGCAEISHKGICKSCSSGYFLSGFNCIKQGLKLSLGCLILNHNGECQFCKNGAAAIQGTCIPIKNSNNLRVGNFQSKQMVSDTISTFSKPLPPNCMYIDNGNGACIKCETNYFLRGLECVAVSPLCNGHNILTGECLDCISGYSKTQNGTCIATTQPLPQPPPMQIQKTQIPNCLQISPNGSCLSCRSPYLQASDGYCYDQKCYSGSKGVCLSCQQGFYIQESITCIQIPAKGTQPVQNQIPNTLQVIRSQSSLPVQQPQQQIVSQSDPYCRQLSPTGQCVACFQSYVLVNNRCTISNQQCASLDSAGRCSSCYAGYIVQNGSCVANLGDPNCKTYSQIKSCVECSNGYFLSNGICTKSNSFCANTDRNGVCLGCYPGYTLRNGNCFIFNQDPNCKQYTNNNCTQCSTGFYMSEGKCALISPMCASANNITGKCLNCYPGYSLNQNSQCVVETKFANCAKIQNNQCVTCVSGSYLRQGSCFQVSPLCSTYDSLSGFCLSCYQGYQLSNGNCSMSARPTNCKTIRNGSCVQCFQGFNLLINRNCLAVNPLCKTSNSSTGGCSSCYQGYALINSNCSLPTNTDSNCVQKSGAFCLSCINGYYILSGSCTRVTKKCAAYEMATGNCINCGAGLALLNGDCVPTAQKSDINCAQVGISGNCAACNHGYFLNTSSSNPSCQLVSQLCLIFNYQKLECTECQTGYFLQDGGCIYPSMGYDKYCERYSGSYCERCSDGYYLSNYMCTQMDPNCVSWNAASGICLQCRVGSPQEAVCV